VEGADHAAAARGWRADASGGGGALSVAMLAVAATTAAAERGDASGSGGVRRDSRAERHMGFCFFFLLCER
jgi:hypothetical protein